MINIVEKEKCCGCGACFEICPKHCIKLVEDEEGFKYPKVNRIECLECGLCEKACPIMNKCYNLDEIADSYVAYSRDLSERLESSSGGIFGVIASEILNKGGIICGAAYDKNCNVSHVCIEKKEELWTLKGSKYVQSSNEGIYSEIRKTLQKGRIVLYSGTACQVAGLKKYLQKEYDNLWTIDILCHGVPSPKLWKKYVRDIEEKNKLRLLTVDFRNKETGWKKYSVKFYFENDVQISEAHSDNLYMRMFLSNLCLRPSCHACIYKDMNRPSDITIGDYWGVEKQMPEMDDDKGVSVIKINTYRGKKLFGEISSRIVYKETDIDNALPSTSDSRKSVSKHPNREIFFKQLDKKSIVQLSEFIKTPLYRRVIRKIKKIF